MKKSNKVSPEEAQANADEIRKFWRAGQQSRTRLDLLQRKNPDAFTHGRKDKTMKEEADRLGMNYDTAQKARRVAEEYSREEIESLCELVVEKCSRFGPTLLHIFLRVEDRRRRDKIMQEAIIKSCTKDQVTRAVQAERGERRQNVGRKPRVPGDPRQRLLALDALAFKFLRWCVGAEGLLPDAVQTLVEQSVKALEKVRLVVASELAAEPQR